MACPFAGMDKHEEMREPDRDPEEPEEPPPVRIQMLQQQRCCLFPGRFRPGLHHAQYMQQSALEDVSHVLHLSPFRLRQCRGHFGP